MNEKYKVTVGIALYNCQEYIERCLNSVLEQTYSNIEIIVVNDGSTDNSLNIVNEIKKNSIKKDRIKIYTKENGGPSSARNYIIEKSTGEFILLIDSDDWLEKDAVEKMMEIQYKYNCDIVKINYCVNSSEDKMINKGGFQKYKDKLIDVAIHKEKLITDILLGNIPAYTWSMLIKKEVIKKELYFEEDIVHLEDKLFLIKLISNVKNIFFSSEILYHYFLNINGLMHKNNFEYYLEKDIELNKIINEIIEEYYNDYKNLFIINNTMSSYAIERNLYNIYKTTNEQKMVEEYNKIKEEWKKISKETDYKYLKNSKYAIKGEHFIKKWNKNNLSSITKSYNIEKYLENIKTKIKAIVRG